MPDKTDEILENLNRSYRTEENAVRITLPSGRSIIVLRDSQVIRDSDGELVYQNTKELTADGSGHVIKEAEQIGGICGRCDSPVHVDSFHHCEQCGLPLCQRCSRIRGGHVFCSWCAIFFSLTRFFTRRNDGEQPAEIEG